MRYYLPALAVQKKKRKENQKEKRLGALLDERKKGRKHRG